MLAATCPGVAAEPAGIRFTGPWDMAQLKKPPAADWGQKTGLVQEVYYAGEPLAGKPTRVFAYYARPEAGDRVPRGRRHGPFPGMVLVHGGGGTAFAQWATLWAKRGYAAIAMDLGGCGPDKKRLDDGMPAQGHPEKFQKFTTDEEARSLWTYHAVAAAIRGHSLLAAREEVDPQQTGLTGISWGGYLTCIVAGLDDRFKVAVPVYGCGFLHENSCWLGEFARLGPEQTKRWVAHYDPSRYLPGVRCPILFVNGTNDFAYPLDSYQKSYRAVPGPVDVRIEVRMPHGHSQGWAPKEIGLYVDSILTGGDPLPKLGPMKTADGKATAALTAKVPAVKGQLHYTTDTGAWNKRTWQTVEAKLADGTIAAALPDARPLVYYLSVTDGRNAMVSTEHAELP
ncbi:MAG: prolyl oligopeptidase family serine peptidase [Candidatus Nealsonbacteria bacterium]|nr:prolyl oligopeptidase family serine peptidase [Candidatus Nealsonbacteria bacterium]